MCCSSSTLSAGLADACRKVSLSTLWAGAAKIPLVSGCSSHSGVLPGNPQQVLGLKVSINKALAGCFVAACLVALLAVVRALNVILSIVPDSIKLATVRRAATAASRATSRKCTMQQQQEHEVIVAQQSFPMAELFIEKPLAFVSI